MQDSFYLEVTAGFYISIQNKIYLTDDKWLYFFMYKL